MGKYEQAYAEFIAKYDLNLNIQTEYDGANRISSIDDFSMDTSPARKAQNVYISTLSSALTDYISKKVKIESGKSYDLANIDVGGFIAEFDKVIDAIRSDEAEKEKTEYTHRKFEGLPFDRVANEAWARVAPGFNKPLHEIWAGQIRNGSLSLEQMQRITSSSTRLLDGMLGSIGYNSAANKDLADVVMIKNAMAEAINKRSWTSWLNPFNWGPNMRENAYLKELNGKINTYRENSFPVDNVVPAMYAGNMLEGALSELQNTYGVRHQPTQNTATAVKTNKKVAVQQNIKAPDVKLSSEDEALARYNEQNVRDNFKSEMEVIFANVNHPMKKFVIPTTINSMKNNIRTSWLLFQEATTNQAKEKEIQNNAISILKLLDIDVYGLTSTMAPADRIVALQKMANVYMRNFTPATSDSQYYKYLDNYFVKNAPLEEVQKIIGNEADVDAVMESACKQLGVEKTKVYLPELSNNKDELKNSDKIEEISPVSKEKTID